jgi:hypothetical protein
MSTEGVLAFVVTVGLPVWLLAEELAHRLGSMLGGVSEPAAAERTTAAGTKVARRAA